MRVCMRWPRGPTLSFLGGPAEVQPFGPLRAFLAAELSAASWQPIRSARRPPACSTSAGGPGGLLCAPRRCALVALRLRSDERFFPAKKKVGVSENRRILTLCIAINKGGCGENILHNIGIVGNKEGLGGRYCTIMCNHTDTEGCVPQTSLELGHLWSYQTQHMCRRLANTHHTSYRTQTTQHTSERGSGISFTRPTPARSISLTTRHYLLLVKCSRRVICRLNSGTHGPLHTHLSVRQWHQHQLHATDACAQHQPRDAPPCSDRDERPRRLRVRQRG